MGETSAVEPVQEAHFLAQPRLQPILTRLRLVQEAQVRLVPVTPRLGQIQLSETSLPLAGLRGSTSQTILVLQVALEVVLRVAVLRAEEAEPLDRVTQVGAETETREQVEAVRQPRVRIHLENLVGLAGLESSSRLAQATTLPEAEAEEPTTEEGEPGEPEEVALVEMGETRLQPVRQEQSIPEAEAVEAGLRTEAGETEVPAWSYSLYRNKSRLVSQLV